MRSTTTSIGTHLAKAHGRSDGRGGTIDTRGQVAILKARQQGISDPERLRAISRSARKSA